MTRKSVHIAFEKAECILPLTSIVTQRTITADYRRRAKYRQIAKSVESVGIIEALVVHPKKADEYLLLDGHSRLDIAQGARCAGSTLHIFDRR